MSSSQILQSQLFNACQNRSLEDLQQLFTKPHITTTILKTESFFEADFRPKRDFVLYVTDTNLHRMLILACEADDPQKVDLLLLFGLQHDVPAEKLVNRETLYAAMDGDNNVALTEKFITVMPDAVNLNMSHAGFPLSHAVGGHLREVQSLPHTRTIGLTRFLLEHGADPNQIMFPDNAPGHYLFVACQRANVEVVRLLLEHGAQIQGSGAVQVATGRVA